MPPAPPTKAPRNSVYGWTKKRSVSPQPKVPLAMPAPPPVRNPHDPMYYEEDYKDEIIQYMTAMDVRI